jgi:endoglucanase
VLAENFGRDRAFRAGIWTRLRVLLPAVSLVMSACIPKAQPGSSPGSENSPEGRPCSGDGVIDDGEDGNNQVLTAKGRGGYWYTFLDNAGSSISPLAGQFSMAQGGGGSTYAAHMTGKVGTGQVVFAGMGFNFTEPKGPYDASAYKGVSFKAKKGAGTAAVRMKVPDGDTDPDGKVCSECFNDFGADLELTDAWTTYVFPFASMRQLAGWGSPHPAAIDPKKLYGIQFQVNSPGASFDIWVDDLKFTGCQ